MLILKRFPAKNMGVKLRAHGCDCCSESVVENNIVKENPRSRAKLYLTKLLCDRAERVLFCSLNFCKSQAHVSYKLASYKTWPTPISRVRDINNLR